MVQNLLRQKRYLINMYLVIITNGAVWPLRRIKGIIWAIRTKRIWNMLKTKEFKISMDFRVTFKPPSHYISFYNNSVNDYFL